MKTLRFDRTSVVLSLAILVSLFAGACGLIRRPSESVAADETRLRSPAVPAPHQACMTALQKRRTLAYMGQTAASRSQLPAAGSAA